MNSIPSEPVSALRDDPSLAGVEPVRLSGRTPEYYAGERERRLRRTSRWQSAVRSLPALAVLLVLLVAFTVAALRRPSPAGSWREAEAVVQRTLAPGERMLVGTRVLRRHWGDHFRATHGVLVATDRRLIYAGVLPPPLLGAADGPPLVERTTFPFDTSLAVFTESGRRRVVVRHGDLSASFALAPESAGRADAIRAVAAHARDALVARLEREQFLHDSIAALPPPSAQVHVVAPGETVIGLGIRYGYSPDSLMQRNGLTNDRIRAGQRLVVREFRRIDGVVQGY